MITKKQIEDRIRLVWGTYTVAECVRDTAFLVIFSPNRSGYVDFEIVIHNRGFYLARLSKVGL